MFSAIITEPLNQLRRRVYQRYPPSTIQIFTRRNLFIFPSRSGFGFLLFLAILWLVGTNYSNNLVLALAFLLSSMFVVCILHTFSNLAGVELEFLSSQPTFNGENAEFTLVVRRKDKRRRENILLGWGSGNTVAIDLIDVAEQRITLFVPVNRRGWFDPGRLLIQTYFPLSFLRCWMYPSLGCKVLVYPKPVSAGPLPSSGVVAEDGEQMLASGAEEFAGYRSYQIGDTLRHVAWKQFARGVGLFSKEFVSHADSRLWLQWDDLPGMDREARLSRLCYWVLCADDAKREFGLRLPGVEFKPGSGPNHKLEALKMLALFEVK